jgi:uncharacterized protein (TIGR02270 family)
MTEPRTTYIPDLVEEHYEELQYLWGRRQSALRSPTITLRAFSALDERIEGHVQGLLIAGDRLMSLVEEGLASDDPAVAFASAYPLLRQGTDAGGSRVLEAFTAADQTGGEGIRQALCHAQVSAMLPALQAHFFSSSAERTAAAAEVLAFNGALPLQLGPIQQLLQDENAFVRRRGWQVVGMSALSVDPKLYSAAMRDADPNVRRAALEAAAWSGLPAAVALGRTSAPTPTPENVGALELLGVLGSAEDQMGMTAVAKAKDLGPARFRILGCYGHPALVEQLLAELGNPDPETACAAGAAFTKLTGQDIDSKERTKLPPENGHEPDEFETEFLEEVRLPDPGLARAHWEKVKPRFARATRICRGYDIAQGASAEALASFDMESRWEYYLRSKFQGRWSGSPVSLERFPQKQ